MRLHVWLPVAAATLLLAAGMIAARAADPDALWKIVHDRCVPDQQEHADPAPCEAVNLTDGPERGYAILKDVRGATQFLLIPTARITGIESQAVLAADTPDYFRTAWAARGRVSARAGHDLPDDDLSLAINSLYGRTQNQLHIHIDCLDPAVHDALAAHAGEIGVAWAPLDVPLPGGPYRAIRLPQDANPFLVLAASLSDKAEMARHTLVMTVSGAAGLVLLDGLADPLSGARGSGEALQDHACALASRNS